ncbi:hypothetical protein C4X49_04865 [Acinetobacter baumannii]|nr:hypothetical protein C4X49_04865 [Acinetobacter baumannii]
MIYLFRIINSNYFFDFSIINTHDKSPFFSSLNILNIIYKYSICYEEIILIIKDFVCPPQRDLFNGEIIAFQTHRRPMYELVKNMLKDALTKLADHEKPIIHSDQGWQYQMRHYQRELAENGLTQSMSRKGNCLDNASMESFFGILKSECFYGEKFNSVEELEKTVKEYIHYYNHERIKVKLKGLSPVQYRTQSLEAA